MKPNPRSLQGLSVIADLLRDRDLRKVADSARRLAGIDRQIEALDSLRDAARDAAYSIVEPREFLRYQAYADLSEAHRATLSQQREDHAASVATEMAEARHSFARATILKTLKESARQKLRRKRLGRGLD
jgi:hypothetical protein